jgi:hypothetical protein
MEKYRIETEDRELKEKLSERLNISQDPDNMGVEIKAILNHIVSEKEEESKEE